jgi:hypothetical protein
VTFRVEVRAHKTTDRWKFNCEDTRSHRASASNSTNRSLTPDLGALSDGGKVAMQNQRRNGRARVLIPRPGSISEFMLNWLPLSNELAVFYSRQEYDIPCRLDAALVNLGPQSA